MDELNNLLRIEELCRNLRSQQQSATQLEPEQHSTVTPTGQFLCTNRLVSYPIHNVQRLQYTHKRYSIVSWYSHDNFPTVVIIFQKAAVVFKPVYTSHVARIA